MKKRPGLYLALSTMLVVSVLLSLVWLTPLPNRKLNGFTRRWLPGPVQLNHRQLPLPVTHIGGAASSHLYFSGSDPRWLLVSDTALNTTDTLYFSLGTEQGMHNLPAVVDSPRVCLYAKNISYLVTGSTNSQWVDTTRLYTPLFTRFAQVSLRLLIIRGFDSTHRQQVFKQIDCTTGQVLKEVMIGEDRHDAGFSMDGMLLYDSATNKLLYVQQYQNRFFCLDTNLQTRYTAHTIDTSYSNNVTVSIVQKETDTKLVPSTARVNVNLDAVAANGLLYVVSGLRADNEEFSDFSSRLPVDVYSIASGKYLGSFHIPKMAGKKMTALFIRGSLLVVLYQHGWASTLQLPAGVLGHGG